jgi:transposase
MSEMATVVGLDIGSSSTYACVLSEMPPDLMTHIRKYKPTIAPPTREGIATIAALGDVFILEPTGAYHRIWAENLTKQGKTVLYAPGIRTRNFARMHGILDKSDRTDAVICAAYGLFHKGNPSAFVNPPAGILREGYLLLRGIPKSKTALINRLRGRLSYELPERAKTTAKDRDWLEEAPPALWREIAGEETRYSKNKKEIHAATIGRGISETSQKLAKFICELDRLEVEIETELEAELSQMGAYRKVFEDWGITPRTQVTILSAIHPIEQFLDSNGKVIVERVFSEKSSRGQTKRNRSLKAFKRAIACGKIRIQSGDSFKQVSTGDRNVKSSIYSFLDTKVVILRQPPARSLFIKYGKPDDWEKQGKKQQQAWLSRHSFRAVIEPEVKTIAPWKEPEVIQKVCEYNGAKPNIAKLQLFYEFAPICQNLPKFRRLAAKVFPRFVEWLFYDLVKECRSSM